MIKALVIGDPIEHSLSPLMHNEAFKQAGIQGSYEARRITKEELPSFISLLRSSDYTGCNITIPHKVDVIPLLDHVDEEALMIGAVNTVVKEQGKLVGYNTDGKGFLLGLKEKLSSPLSSLNILVVGAGGAARSIVYALLQEQPNSITICNRSSERLENLISRLKAPNVKGVTIREAEEGLSIYDLIINTTNVGMYPNMDSIPLGLDRIKKGAFVSEIIYNPFETNWLKSAQQKGAVTDNGISMLVMQGALAFEKWTSIFPDTDKMTQAVLQKLGGNYVNR